MEELKVGDVVILNSGGPNMLVKSIKKDKATCVWVREEKLDKCKFPIVCLTKKVS